MNVNYIIKIVVMIVENLVELKNIWINKNIKKHMVMGLDVSKNKIGVALSDENLILSFPYKDIIRTKANKDYLEILKIFKEKNISTIVVGYPLFLDGGFSPRCKSILDFCEGLLKLENIDIYLQDERFSTNFVKNNLKKIDKKNNYHDSIDSKSASWFLQIFIDKLKYKI
jgi:putative Holliday junction resolvase